VFSGEMSYIVFNPWWETPTSIARLDKLPVFRTDPGAIERLGFEILDRAGRRIDPATVDWRNIEAKDFPFRLRQRPGPQNALGQAKLMFPNVHNVYLHDTPSRDLFSRQRRDFSSGCIRVRNAIDLAAWVLEATPGWDRPRIDRALETGAETTATLARKLQVHIMYMTAVRAEDGTVRFLEDIYDRDSRLIKALDVRLDGA
ncbi:MAG: L,D-transpeptidase family protein, partial [Rhodospirillaceae bacterium]